MAGESLFCIKGRDGEIRTFYNVCQHRAHQLVSGEGSTRVVVCPYHAWTYELTGELRAAPNTKSVPGFDKSAVCLTEVRTELFLGFIFVNLDPDAAPMDAWFPGVREELMEWLPHWESLKPLEWVEIPENCNWKVSVENYSECYHCSLNHPTFATGIIKPETYDIQPEGYCLRHTTECQSLENMSYDIDRSKPHSEEYSSWFLWPMFSFQVYPGNVLNTYHWRAIDPDHVVVRRGWYTEGGWEYDLFFDRGQSFPGEAVRIESTELICQMVVEKAGASILPRLSVAMSACSARVAVAELDVEPISFDWHLLHGGETAPGLLDRIEQDSDDWLQTAI